MTLSAEISCTSSNLLRSLDFYVILQLIEYEVLREKTASHDKDNTACHFTVHADGNSSAPITTTLLDHLLVVELIFTVPTGCASSAVVITTDIPILKSKKCWYEIAVRLCLLQLKCLSVRVSGRSADAATCHTNWLVIKSTETGLS